MANNRMYLVNNRLGQRILVAKYYPFLPDPEKNHTDPWRPEPCGWFVMDRGKLTEQLQNGFDSDNIFDQNGPTDWRLEYENDKDIPTFSEIFLDVTDLTEAEEQTALALVKEGKVKLELPKDWRLSIPVVDGGG